MEKGQSDEPTRRRTIKFFIEDKFNNTSILNKLKEFGFNEGTYTKVIVTIDYEKSEKMNKLLQDNNIEIWTMDEIMKEMMSKIDTKYYGDDVIRTLQIYKISQSKK